MISKETEKLINIIKNDIKQEMSENRYIHSIGVMNKAIELANIYGTDENEAAIAGILHDIAKEIPMKNGIEICQNNGIQLDEIEIRNYSLVHGKLGAFLANDRYNVSENIQNAIKYHTTTNPQMNILAKIIYVSDKVEDGRNSNEFNIKEERELANVNIDKAIIMIIESSISRLLKKKMLIHPNSVITRNNLIIKQQE